MPLFQRESSTTSKRGIAASKSELLARLAEFSAVDDSAYLSEEGFVEARRAAVRRQRRLVRRSDEDSGFLCAPSTRKSSQRHRVWQPDDVRAPWIEYDRLVLVGDQCQLPPTVLDAKQGEVAKPLFTRLLATVRPHLLDTQYRMHPVLSAFANDAVYAGRLCDGVHPRDRALEDRVLRSVGAAVGAEGLAAALPFALVHVPGRERDDAASKSNDDEAAAVARAVGACLAGGLAPADIAVLSPYSAQVRAVRRALRNAGVDCAAVGLEVSSVDAIQGREKEVVILSTVRANAEGKLGFVADWRRLNVALTRARRCALVLGDVRTLAADPEIWRPFLSWALAAGVANRGAVEALRGEKLAYDLAKVRTHAIRRTPSLGADYLPAPVLDEVDKWASKPATDSVFDDAYATAQADREADLAKIASAASLVSLASQQDSVKDAWDDSDSDDAGATKDGGWGDDDA
ncbi:nonsense-mediated decay protein [Aureococcus anophagefferens]|uniref:Nonsense-mediated decay protein n=2 Tax=Aureococcus anophagefferens TaxID=44056 RepID=A0ABR1FP45_AURAN